MAPEILSEALHSGDLATWVGSTGIALTIAATVWQVGREARLRRQERSRAQAVAVSAWYVGDFMRPGVDGATTSDQSAFAVSNDSAQPIYEVVVSMVYIQGAAPHSIEDWIEVRAVGNRELPYGRIFSAVGPGKWSMRTSADCGHTLRPHRLRGRI